MTKKKKKKKKEPEPLHLVGKILHSSKLEGYFVPKSRSIECGSKVIWTNGNKCIERAMTACKMEAIQRAYCA